MVFSILRMVSVPRNLVEILIKNSAFCLNQTYKAVYFCPTQCIGCSLMRVLVSLGHENLISLLGMRSCNEDEKMPKWDILNASVLLNPLSAKDVLIVFTLSNARRFYSSKETHLALKGLKNYLP